IEGPRAQAAEVAKAWDRYGDEAVKKFPHPRAAQSNSRPDLLALPQSEIGDRLLRFFANGLLTGDRRQFFDYLVEHLRLLDGFADADVEDDLLQRRYLVRIREAELLHELR